MNEARVRTNNALGTLGATMLVGDTTINFGATAPNLPTIAAGQYLAIAVEPNTANEEVIYLTAYTAGQLTGTILRGQEGSTAIQHPAAAIWIHGPTKYDPVPSPFDRVPPTTYDDEFDATTLDSKWSWFNQGTASYSLSKSRIGLVLPSNAGSDIIHGLLQTLPAAPWEFTMWCAMTLGGGGPGAFFGMYVQDSAGVKYTSIMLQNTTTNIVMIGVGNWAAYNSFSAYLFQQQIGSLAGVFLRIKDDGTNLLYSFSLDGVFFQQVASAGRLSYLTGGGTKIGFGGDPYNQPIIGAVDFFRRTA